MELMDVEGAAPPAEEDFLLHLPFSERVESKNWKVRAKAYESFNEELEARINDRDELRHLGTLVCKMTADANANALDCGLDGALAYFDKVDNQTASDYLEKCANNIIDKALSSRPSTLAKAKAILMMMMEVHEPHAVVPLLIAKLGDKKPKVPPACLDIILDGLISFGVAKYPVKDLIKCLPNALNSSNASLRDFAMKTLLELHRWIGVGPLLPTLDALRPAQRADFDKQMADLAASNQIHPVPNRLLRVDVIAGVDLTKIVKSTAVPDTRDFVEELDIPKRLKNTEFSTLLVSEKWVEQSQALQILIDAIGPTPKIKQSPTTYDLVKSMHELLKNGHLQVQTKILRIIALMADGLRGKFSADVRQLMSTILSKVKDKKMSSEVENTCLAIFKYSLSIDTQTEDMSEILASKKSPPHAKISICVILQNCVKDGLSFNNDSLKSISDALVGNSEDSDSKVREESAKCLASFCKCEKFADFCSFLLRNLKGTAPKLHKRIIGVMEQSSSSSSTDVETKLTTSQARPSTTSQNSTISASGKSGKLPSHTRTEPTKISSTQSASVKSSVNSAPAKKVANGEGEDLDAIEEVSMTNEDAMEILNTCGLDCAAKVAMLASVKWQDKVEAVDTMKGVTSVGIIDARTFIAIYVFISHNTSGLKISNINVLKAVIDCFTHLLTNVEDARGVRSVALRLCDGIADKFGDKKLQQSLEDYLRASRSLVGTVLVVKKMNRVVDASKSPAVHQAHLVWLKELVGAEGVSEFPVLSTVPFLLKELENKNSAIRTAAIEMLGVLFSKIGPPLQVLLTQKELSSQLRSLLEAEFQKVGFVAVETGKGKNVSGLALPRKDIAELLDKNTINELTETEGKDSWQLRKAAIEKIMSVCEGSGHYLDCSKTVIELLRLLKMRLSDTQSNLKPLAVSAIAHIIASLETEKAVKALKQYAAGLLEGLMDNRKQMRDATLTAMNLIVSQNSDKVEKTLFMAFVTSCGDVMNNIIARQEIVPWQLAHKEYFFGDCNDLVANLMGCLQDKSGPVRNSAESLLSHLLCSSHISRLTIDRFALDLAPAVRRTVQPVLDRLTEAKNAIDQEKKESIVSTSAPVAAVSIASTTPDKFSTTRKSVPWSEPMQQESLVFEQSVEEEEEESVPMEEAVFLKRSPESVLKVVEALHWPSVPSAEDYLHLLSEWQSIREPNSLDILFGDFVGSDTLQNEVLSIVESCPEEQLFIFFWLTYNLDLPRSNLSRAVSLVRCASIVAPFFGNDKTEHLAIIVRGCLSCVGRHDDEKARDSLNIFFRTLRRTLSPSTVPDLLITGFESSTTSSSKQLSTEALIDYFVSEGVAATSRYQIVRLFQRLSIDSRLASAFLKTRLKFLVETLIAKIGDVRLLLSVLKREPKEMFSSLNISLVVETDSNVLEIVSHTARTLSSKVFVAINMLMSGPCSDRLSLSHLELLELLRKLTDVADEAQTNVLDSSFFLRLLNFCIEKRTSDEIWFATIALLFNTLKQASFFSACSSSNHQALMLLLTQQLIHGLNPKVNKVLDLTILEFGARSNVEVVVPTLLNIVDSHEELFHVCTRLLLYVLRGILTHSDEWAISALDALGEHVLTMGVHERRSIKSINSAIKMLCGLVGMSKLNTLISKSSSGHFSALHSLASKHFENYRDAEVLNTELVAIIKEVTTSIDKFSAVRRLFLFKKNNPSIDVDLHLLKLSSAFRHFVSETMQQLASEEIGNSGKENENMVERREVSTNSPTSSASEALRLMDSLKKLPVPEVVDRLEEPQISKPPPQSPFAKRNDVIRAGLNSLSKSLDLRVDI